MAFASDSITAPALQRGLLPFAFRPVPSVDDPRSTVEILDEIRRTIEAQEAAAQPELPPEPLLLLPAPRPSLPAALSRRRSIFGAVAVDESDTAAEARTIHLRRQLEAAAEHGADLLASLGLPQLAALDEAIAVLDAVDGDPEVEDDDPAEAEADKLSLGWPDDIAARLDLTCAADPDAEHDTADLEDSDSDEDHREPWPGAVPHFPLAAVGEARP